MHKAEQFTDRPADFGLPDTHAGSVAKRVPSSEKQGFAFFRAVAAVLDSAHPVVTGNDNLIAFREPLRDNERQQAVGFYGGDPVFETLRPETVSGVIDVHGVDEQKIRLPQTA